MSIFVLYKFSRKEWIIKQDVTKILQKKEVKVYKWPTYGESLLKEEYAESMNQGQ